VTDIEIGLSTNKQVRESRVSIG
jgi:hypothetical protein